MGRPLPPQGPAREEASDALAAAFQAEFKLEDPKPGSIKKFMDLVAGVETCSRAIGLSGAKEPCPWFLIKGARSKCKEAKSIPQGRTKRIANG